MGESCGGGWVGIAFVLLPRFSVLWMYGVRIQPYLQKELNHEYGRTNWRSNQALDLSRLKGAGRREQFFPSGRIG